MLACLALLVGHGPGAAGALELIGRDSAEIRWAPSSGGVSAYVVFVSRNGGPYRSEQYTPLPRARVAGGPGETIQVRVRAYGVEDGRTLTSEASPPSEPIRFAAARADASPPAAVPAKAAPALARRAPAAQPGAPLAASGLEQIPGFQFVPPIRIETSGDLDGDGDFDLLVTLGSWEHPLALFLEDGSLEHVAALPARTGATKALSADFDGDGTDEIALQTAREVALLRVNRKGKITPLRRIQVAAGSRILAADLNGDGTATLVTYEPKTGRLVEHAAGGADFGSIQPLHTLLAGDFNGDGRDDLWVQARHGTDAEIWLMDGSGGFRVSSIQLSRAPTAAATADVDGDGRDDLAGYDATRDELRAWLLDGGRVVSERTLAHGPVESVQRGDIDGDGLDDLLLRAPDGASSALILSP